ncbi:MAG: hypothetical protein M1825_001955 [Sarcosagium campestre]|nr:MAG: hypothetical protein M1825_001955 [Sarcosagium campestre]
MADVLLLLLAVYALTVNAAPPSPTVPPMPSLSSASSLERLPLVNVGEDSYHRAIEYNEETGFYNFSNIRFAEPPVGLARFAAPVAARPEHGIDQGEVGRMCPQAFPTWIARSMNFVPDYLRGRGSDYDNVTVPTIPSLSPDALASIMPRPDARENEDCLFLDIFVPKEFLPRSKRKRIDPAPVIVWFHGGGYVSGDKSGLGSPAGLLERSKTGTAKGVIIVAINYRLGAYGWLGGPTFEKAGVPNAGLLDQRLGLEWVQEHIHVFGGDASRVTVMGDSAGGGSILHQLTAFGGKDPAPFQQAIVQSPAFTPQAIGDELDAQLERFLKTAAVDSIEEARDLSPAKLRYANYVTVGYAPYGRYEYGPSVDGIFVQDLPGRLLEKGKFSKNVMNIMTGHNLNEGLQFTPPYVHNNDDFMLFLRSYFPSAESAELDYVARNLYPPVLPGSAGYRDQTGRTALFISEGTFTCNTVFLARAFSNTTFNYLFSVPPALNGADLPYTFFDGNNKEISENEQKLALALQTYLTGFAQSGSPSGPQMYGSMNPGGLQNGYPVFRPYGVGSQVLDLNPSGIRYRTDPAASERCAWWQRAPFL